MTDQIVARVSGVDFVDVSNQQNDLALFVNERTLLLWTPTGIKTIAFVEDLDMVDLTQLEIDLAAIKDNLGGTPGATIKDWIEYVGTTVTINAVNAINALVPYIDGIEAKLDALNLPETRQTITFLHSELTTAPLAKAISRPSAYYRTMSLYARNDLNQQVALDLYIWGAGGHLILIDSTSIISNADHRLIPSHNGIITLNGGKALPDLQEFNSGYTSSPTFGVQVTPLVDPTSGTLTVVVIWRP